MSQPAEHADIVEDSRLNATPIPGTGDTRQVSVIPASKPGERPEVRVEIWRRVRDLGPVSAKVWVEKCVVGRVNQERVLKEIQKPTAGKDVYLQARASYNQELHAIAKFSLPKYVHCFVQSYGWFETDSTVRIAMEYLRHGDLQQWLGAAFPETEAARIASQLLEGLDYMHTSLFAHRDLKPANVLVVKPRPSWWVKIADFGISKRFDEATALRTMYIGTQGYMAPEVLGIIHPDDNDFDPSNNLTYDQKVDMWALGEITYRMLACQPCFANPRLLNFYVIRDSTFPLGPLREAAASSACCDFVRAAMAPRPRTRMSAAEGLAHDWINALLDVDVGSLSLNEAPAGEDTASPQTAIRIVPVEDPPSNVWSTLGEGESGQTGLQLSLLNAYNLPPPVTFRPPSIGWDTATYNTHQPVSGQPLIGGDTATYNSPKPVSGQPLVGGDMATYNSPPGASEPRQPGPKPRSLDALRSHPDVPWALGTATGTADMQMEIQPAKKLYNGLTVPLTMMAFSPDGRCVAAAGRRPVIGMWISNNQGGFTLTQRLTTEGSNIFALGFSHDSKSVVAASRRRFALNHHSIIYIWTLDNGGLFRRVHDLRVEEEVSGFAFSPNGTFASTGDNHTIRIWTGNGERPLVEIQRLRGQYSLTSDPTFSPDGKWLTFLSTDFGMKGAVCEIWMADISGRFLLVHQFKEHSLSHIRALTLPPYGECKWLALFADGDLGSEDRTVQILTGYDRGPFVVTQELTGPGGIATSSPDGKWLATNRVHHTEIRFDIIDLWKADSQGRYQWATSLESGNTEAREIYFSADSRRLATICQRGSATWISVWNI